MITDADYLRAQEEESYRPKFLEQIAAEGLPRYVRRLDYNPQAPQRPETIVFMDIIHYPFGGLFNSYTSSIITIYPTSFGADYCLDDFLSLLEDHEYYHAKEFHEAYKKITNHFPPKIRNLSSILSPNSFNYQQLKKAREVRAYQNQIDNFPQHSCSLAFMMNMVINKDRFKGEETIFHILVDSVLSELSFNELKERMQI